MPTPHTTDNVKYTQSTNYLQVTEMYINSTENHIIVGEKVKAESFDYAFTLFLHPNLIPTWRYNPHKVFYKEIVAFVFTIVIAHGVSNTR